MHFSEIIPKDPLYPVSSFVLFFNYLYIWLCGFQLWHVNLVAACGIQFPDQGLNPGTCTVHWELRVPALGPPGKSPFIQFSLIVTSCRTDITTKILTLIHPRILFSSFICTYLCIQFFAVLLYLQSHVSNTTFKTQFHHPKESTCCPFYDRTYFPPIAPNSQTLDS